MNYVPVPRRLWQDPAGNTYPLTRAPSEGWTIVSAGWTVVNPLTGETRGILATEQEARAFAAQLGRP